MRGVAQAAATTTPTLYERYRDRDALLRAVRARTRAELFAALSQTRTLLQACECQLEFAMQHSHAYEVLFDGIGQAPSLHEPWPSFNLYRQRLAERLGGTPRQHTRLMLSLWSLMHGTAMLLIRGRVTEPLRSQMLHACLDAVEAVVERAASPARQKRVRVPSGRPACFSAKASTAMRPRPSLLPKLVPKPSLSG